MRRSALLLGAALLGSGGIVAVATSAQAAAGCKVDYQVTSSWQGGFGAAVSITNLGDAITSWRLTWSYPAGQAISQLWNGTVTQSGSQVTVTNASYNGALGTGGSASFGFNGSWTGSNPAPAAFSLNGTVCTGAPTTSGPSSTPPSSTPSSTPPSSTPPSSTPPSTPPSSTPPSANPPRPATDPSTALRVNQVAYVPGSTKQATLVSSSTSPVAWILRTAAGVTVASGQTTVKGADAASGDRVHLIDFSAYDTVGTGYVLSAGGADSYAFDISADAIKKLRYDALAFFYHQRSGTPIQAQYVGSAWARPAGHVNVAPNQGDNNVPCRVSCGYTQDLRGGWYDAGDQGKYVVNGGISSWQLQNEYERAATLPGGNASALGDGTLAIPERANGVPDILDEARWEVEFLLKMQVPAGRTDAGMARHKVSDENWTGLPQRPELDSQRRVSSAVSTAATLNLAAVAAQSARLWKTYDPTFSATALAAARRAYTAAKANPARYADTNDTSGSGTYGDSSVTDEFYWAAAELYATTGESGYRNDVTSSSLYRGASFTTQGFDWWWTGGLGDVTLATVPNGLPSGDIAAIKQAVVSFADRMLAVMAGNGYPAPTSTYVWGSSGTVANNANALALAYDFTGQRKYRDGVYQALDYLLGRNPLNRSYVAGYGENAAQKVHHRFWARSLDASLPPAPAGSVAGGPNRELQDPIAVAQLGGCAPQRCYVDNIEAYSVNEVALNWNSSVAWLAGWAAEKAG